MVIPYSVLQSDDIIQIMHTCNMYVTLVDNLEYRVRHYSCKYMKYAKACLDITIFFNLTEDHSPIQCDVLYSLVRNDRPFHSFMDLSDSQPGVHSPPSSR